MGTSVRTLRRNEGLNYIYFTHEMYIIEVYLHRRKRLVVKM